MPVAPSVENMAGFTKYMARASTVLSAIHVRLIHASVWLHRNRRDVGPSVAFERQRRIAAGGWQRPVFFSVEIVAGPNQNWNRAVPRYRRRGTCAVSFDDLVGAGENRWRDRYPQRLGGVETQLEPGRLLDRQIGRLRAGENPAGIGSGQPIDTREVRSVADQPAGGGERPFVDRRNR